MRVAWKSLIVLTVVLSFALYFTGCSEDNEIISDNEGTPTIKTVTGCVGCHTDAELLEELAVPEDNSGSSGEG